MVTLGLEVMTEAEEAVLEDWAREVDWEEFVVVKDVDKGKDGALILETDDSDEPVVTGGLVTSGALTGAEEGRSDSSSIFGMSCRRNSTPGAVEAILCGRTNEEEVVAVVDCEMVARDKVSNQ